MSISSKLIIDGDPLYHRCPVSMVSVDNYPWDDDKIMICSNWHNERGSDCNLMLTMLGTICNQKYKQIRYQCLVMLYNQIILSEYHVWIMNIIRQFSNEMISYKNHDIISIHWLNCRLLWAFKFFSVDAADVTWEGSLTWCHEW